MKTVFLTDGRGPCTGSIVNAILSQGLKVVVNGPHAHNGTTPSQLDLGNGTACAAFFSQQFGPDAPDELVGVIVVPPPLQPISIADTSDEAWNRAFSECVLPAFIVTQAAGAILTQQGHGALIFLGSIHAEKPSGCAHLDAEAAAACQMLCREAALDFGSKGVHCVYVQRGLCDQDPLPENALGNVYHAPALQHPARHLPDATSINGIVLFLLSPAAAALNGSDLRADFGMTMFYGWQAPDPTLPSRWPPTGQRHHHQQQPNATSANAADAAPAAPVAIITGGGKGVGAGIAKVFCRAGIRVCIGYNSNAALAQQTLADINAAGGDAFLFQADVSRRDDIKAMVAACAQRFGGVDILVNNAALQPNRFIHEYDAQTLRSTWDINIGGYLRCCQECLPLLQKSPCPRIINISSIHGKRPSVFDVGYAMSKAAIRLFTREAALEFRDAGITVNAVDLGACKIEFKTGNYPFRLYVPPETMQRPRHHLKHLTTPDHVGHLALYLASPTAATITGAGIRIDGGAVLT